MHTHVKTGTTSFANSFLLLVVFAGILNVALPESDIVSGHGDHRILYRIELAFDAGNRSVFPVLSISEVIPGNDAAACVFRSHFRSTRSGVSSLIIQDTGPVNSRPFYGPHNHARAFNIPHQNSGEDDAFIFRVDVA